jgi:preprotein translocase subunit SecD
MDRRKPALSVIEGLAAGPMRIALSLVHPRARIDIPVKDVLKIEALAEQTFFFSDTWTSKSYRAPHVRLEFAPHIGARIHRLTSQIVGEELPIVVAGTIVSRPVVREPHGVRETFSIKVHDMDDARALAAKLREGWVVPNLRVV